MTAIVRYPLVSPGRGPARLKHGTVPVMATKANRRAARARVSACHESQLAGLLGHVGAELDRYRAGEIDAYTADETIHHYPSCRRRTLEVLFRPGRRPSRRVHRRPPGPYDRRGNHRLVGTRRTATTPMTQPCCAARAWYPGSHGPWPRQTTV